MIFRVNEEALYDGLKKGFDDEWREKYKENIEEVNQEEWEQKYAPEKEKERSR